MPTSRPSSCDTESLRVDAERNRTRILAAARQVYAEHGLDVPMSEVARRAGVGIATLYRRFPTGDDLVAATFASKMDGYAAAAEAALEADDVWTGLAQYLHAVCEMQSADAGFADILALAPREAFADQRSRAIRAFTKLLRRARDAGVVRPDFVHHDLVMLLMANAGLVRATNGNRRASRRFTEYMLQSFRAPGGGPLPSAPTARETYDALR